MSKRYYKLTNQWGETANNTQWGEGVTHKAEGKGTALCSKDLIHVYDHPLKAILFNPVHASFENPKLWECKVRKVVADDTLKVGVKQCTTIKKIPLPEITIEQRVKFAIYCALEGYKEPSFVRWAEGWLSGRDRTLRAVYAAAAAGAARYAAHAAAHAAAQAADAARYAARYAARAAAQAADAAPNKINFVKLIKKAIKGEK